MFPNDYSNVYNNIYYQPPGQIESKSTTSADSVMQEDEKQSEPTTSADSVMQENEKQNESTTSADSVLRGVKRKRKNDTSTDSVAKWVKRENKSTTSADSVMQEDEKQSESTTSVDSALQVKQTENLKLNPGFIQQQQQAQLVQDQVIESFEIEGKLKFIQASALHILNFNGNPQFNYPRDVPPALLKIIAQIEVKFKLNLQHLSRLDFVIFLAHHNRLPIHDRNELHLLISEVLEVSDCFLEELMANNQQAIQDLINKLTEKQANLIAKLHAGVVNSLNSPFSPLIIEGVNLFPPPMNIDLNYTIDGPNNSYNFLSSSEEESRSKSVVTWVESVQLQVQEAGVQAQESVMNVWAPFASFILPNNVHVMMYNKLPGFNLQAPVQPAPPQIDSTQPDSTQPVPPQPVPPQPVPPQPVPNLLKVVASNYLCEIPMSLNFPIDQFCRLVFVAIPSVAQTHAANQGPYDGVTVTVVSDMSNDYGTNWEWRN